LSLYIKEIQLDLMIQKSFQRFLNDKKF